MIRKLMGCVTLVVGVALAGCGASANRSYSAPSTIAFPYQWLGNIDKDKFNDMVDELYKFKGLDKNGRPTKKTLKRLGLENEPSHLV